MSNKRSRNRKGGHERRISVRAVRRDPPDLKKLSQALIALAMAQAEKEAQQQVEKNGSDNAAADPQRDDAHGDAA